ncbi:hypothetical protein Ctob_001383 [Chrysochromulina tobinii]|uniref:Uncharacterized protein n=1 Tax=Chrysochromulina tobinii TaxID=1460289 RepID=A0A0M0JJ73_9EUKA|nr:hypothetical protein Ctob_001383 [Chrysochromulina tobinii]|eukprot:KOO26293.1 hypothetical protein Ctob_001383 [Chrysochromulina sp. CCMP291]
MGRRSSRDVGLLIGLLIIDVTSFQRDLHAFVILLRLQCFWFLFVVQAYFDFPGPFRGLGLHRHDPELAFMYSTYLLDSVTDLELRSLLRGEFQYGQNLHRPVVLNTETNTSSRHTRCRHGP